MRKCLRVLLLATVFTALLCGSALAAEERGINAVTPNDGVTMQPQTAQGNEVSADTNGLYADSERIKLGGLTVSSDQQYLVFVLEESKTSTSVVPDADNIVYIDQKAGSDITVENAFDLYPSRLVSGKTYNVYVTSAATGIENAKVGSFGYYAEFTPGDVDGNGKYNINDVMPIINHMTNKTLLTGTALSAADTNNDGKININDIMNIINAIAGKESPLNQYFQQ